MAKVKILQLLLFVGFILLITGCQKTISIDVGQIQPRLVVNSILDKDSIIRVQLSKSKSMMDSTQSIDRVNVATVKIFQDNVLKQTLTKGINGLYNSTIKPIVASDYRIEIDNTSFGHVEATALIPLTPNPLSAVQTTELTPGSAPQYIKFKIGLKDEGIAPDYYYLRAFLIKKGFAPGANSKYVISCRIGSDDNIVVVDDQTLNGVIFDDAAFVKSNYELIVYTNYRINTDFSLWFELSSITSDYYKYLVSCIMQNNAGNNPFAEPVVIKSNIQNGTGIFGAKNSVFIKATTL
jgi:hypothetical protein